MKKFFTIILALLALQAVKAQGTVNVEITDANWATYWLTDGVDFTSNSDIAAYKVTTVKESTVELSLVTGGVAGDIVIVAGLEGVYKVNVDPNATPVTGNLLKVSAEDVVSNGNYYGLKLYEGVLGFYRTAAGNEVPAGKGYLVIGGNNKPVYGLELDAAGIESATVNSGDGKFYNLQGMEVSHPVRGIYIHNGKKIVVK